MTDFVTSVQLKNIYRRRDLSNDACTLSFKSHLLPFQIKIIHSILRHMITLRQGHSDEATCLDIGLLDSLIQGRTVNIDYTISHFMLISLSVSKRSFPYKSIITRIFCHFRISFTEPIHIEI